MSRHRPEGHEFVAANGYHYRKVNGTFRLVHHLIAEEKLGHPLDTTTHRVFFKDKDRDNLDPDNVIVAEKRNSRYKRIETIKRKIALLEDELRDLER